MNWLLFEDKMIALDKFNTILDPIMTFVVILLIILGILSFHDYTENYLKGEHVFNSKTIKIINLLLFLVVLTIIIVGLTNIIQHYLEQLMLFDGYMYINYAKKIIEIRH